MSDEPTQDQDKVPAIDQESMAVEETKPGKKSKAAKKKTAAESLPEQELAPKPVAEPVVPPAPEPVAEPVVPPAPGPVAEPIAPPAPGPVAEPIAPPAPELVADPIESPAPEPVVTTEKAAPSDRDDDLFQQGVQSLLRGEYDAADNFFGQALIVYRKNGDQASQIDVLEQLGHLCYLRGAEAQAREYYHQAGLMRNT